jgi:hypothetical protein
MKISLRKILLVIWAIAVIATGVLISKATGVSEYGWAASLSLLSISLGVPLMRALTEFSK